MNENTVTTRDDDVDNRRSKRTTKTAMMTLCKLLLHTSCARFVAAR